MANKEARLQTYLLETSQAAKEQLINSSLYVLAALATGGVTAIASQPPTNPSTGSSWIVGSDPTGVWEGKANQIAYRVQANTWLYVTPPLYQNIWVQNPGNMYHYTGTNWEPLEIGITIEDFNDRVRNRVIALTPSTPSIDTTFSASFDRIEYTVIPNTTVQKIRLFNSGALVGQRSQINLIPGNNVTFAIADDNQNDRIDFTINSSAAAPNISSYAEYITVDSSGRTVQLNDHNKTYLVTAACTIILPDLSENVQVNVRSQTTGTITFTAASEVTRNPTTGNLLSNTKNVHLQYNKSSKIWYLTGFLG